MLRGKIYSTAVLSCVVAGCFVCSPVFADGPVNISIIEVVDDGNGGYKAWEDITDAMPGMTYSAIPRVKNDGAEAVSIQMCLSQSVKDVDGNEKVSPVKAFEVNINPNWTFDAEGSNDKDCYNYNVKLPVGEMTEPLFTEVTLSGSVGNGYENNTFGLHLDAEATGEEYPPVPEPDDPGASDIPSSPDTGGNTFSYLANISPVLISGGAITLFAVVACVIRDLAKKK